MKRFHFFKTKRNKQKRRGKVSTSRQIVPGDKHPNSSLSTSIITNHQSSSESFTEHQKYGDKYTSIYEVPSATTTSATTTSATTPLYPLQRSIDSNSSNLILPKYPRWNRKGLQSNSAPNALDNTRPTTTYVVSKSISSHEDKFYHDSSLLSGEEDVAFLTFSDSYHDTTDSHDIDYSSRETQTSISSNSSIYSHDSTDTNPEVCDALNVVMRYFCTSLNSKEKQSAQLEQNHENIAVVVSDDNECVDIRADNGFKGGNYTNEGQVHRDEVTDTHEDNLERQVSQDELERQVSQDETKEATKDIVILLPKLESKEQIKSTLKYSRMNLLKKMRHSITNRRFRSN
jgi:hypothetical protein